MPRLVEVCELTKVPVRRSRTHLHIVSASKVVLAVWRIADRSLPANLRVTTELYDECVLRDLIVPVTMSIATPRVRTSRYEDAIEAEGVAMFFAWCVEFGESCCPAEADSRIGFVEGCLVLVAVWDYVDAFVVLGPESGLVAAKPYFLSVTILN